VNTIWGKIFFYYAGMLELTIFGINSDSFLQMSQNRLGRGDDRNLALAA
jgi:hypothetical protein